MKWFVFLLLLACCLSQGFGAVVRTLTHSNGRKIEAEITGIWQGKVTFLRVSDGFDGTPFTVPINLLSPEDQDFLNQRIHLLTLPPPDSGFANGAVIVVGSREA